VVIAICVILYYYKDQLADEKVQTNLTLIPTIGGALFGFNTLVNLVK
jgi:hypothetical protein